MAHSPAISVVIPTILRPEVVRAIRSARSQVDVEVEIVVVVDRERAAAEGVGNLLSDADTVLWTGGGRRGGFARNLGTDAANGDFIAYLDDDDWWHPSKLIRQLTAAMAAPAHEKYVIGSRVEQRMAGTEESGMLTPTRLIAPGQQVADYLFRNRRPTSGRASFFTSTLFARKSFLSTVRWTEDLSRHQDWDLLIRLQNAGAVFHQLDEALVYYATGSENSVSSQVDWRSSFAWGRSWATQWSPQTYVDFIVAQPLRYAIQSRSRTGVKECLAEIAHAARFPNVAPSLFAAGAMIPRDVILKHILRNRSHRRHGASL